MIKTLTIFVCLCTILVGCGNGRSKNTGKEKVMNTDSTTLYGYNRDFLRKHTRIIELKNKNAAVAIAPDWQGRVMTSTQDGDGGLSFGWINRELIASGKLSKHINAFGGEERIWLGPEGGQF